MFSSSAKFLTISAFALSTMIAGCSGAFNDKPKEQSTINLGGSETQCLADAPVRIKNYFEGKSSDKEISGFWDCTSKALELFINHTKGQNTDSYKPEELKNFFQKYFIGNNKISDEFLTQAMILKDAVLGGGQDKISKKEIKHLMDLTVVFKEQSVRLLRFQPFYGEEFKIKSEETTDLAASELIDSAKILGIAIGKNTKSYEFKNFGKLLTELDKYFTASGTPVPAVKTVHSYLALIQSTKNILVSRPREIIAGDDWERLLVTVTKWYSWYLKLSNFQCKYVEFLWGPGLKRLKTIIDEAKNHLVGAIKTWPDETVDFTELDLLVDAINGDDNRLSKWFVKGMTTKAVKDAIRPIIRNIFGGYDITTTGRNANGLTVTALERFHGEIARFVEGQAYFEELFNTVKGVNAWDESIGVTAEELLTASKKVEEKFNTEIGKDVVKDMKHIFQTYRPLFLKKEAQIFFNPPDALDKKHTFYNLMHMNWMHGVSRIITHAYGGNTKEHGNAYPEGIERAKNHGGLRKEEFNKLYLDIFDLGVQLHLFSSVQTNPLTSESRFMEANLFAFSSDGGEYLSLDEMTQMFAILLSSKTLSNKVYNGFMGDLIQKGICSSPMQQNGTYELDEYGNIQIDSSCFEREFFQTREDGKNRFAIFAENMPGLDFFYKNLDTDQRKNFEKILIEAIRGERKGSPLWNTDDTDVLATLSHYIEAVFSRFDDNGDTILSKIEAYDKSGKTDDAFHVFEYELGKITCKKKRRMLKNIFLYMLKYGEPPNPTNFKGTVKYLWWTVIEPFSKVKAKRSTILAILSTLSTMSSTPNTDKGCSSK